MNEEEIKKLLAENNKALAGRYDKEITHLLDKVRERDEKFVGILGDTFITATVLLNLLVDKAIVTREEVNEYRTAIALDLENKSLKSFDIRSKDG